MHVPLFLLYQQTYVPEMCTKTLNEKPVDMSSGTAGELVGLRLSSVQLARWLTGCHEVFNGCVKFPQGDGCWEHGWIRPSHSLLLHKHSSSSVMDETGRSLPLLYLWEQQVLSPLQWMPLYAGGEGKKVKKKKKKRKDIWHWNELQAFNSSSGHGKFSQFVIWTYQKWKWGRPPELAWAPLLFQSCSLPSTGC